jgi:hypothetical protein
VDPSEQPASLEAHPGLGEVGRTQLFCRHRAPFLEAAQSASFVHASRHAPLESAQLTGASVAETHFDPDTDEQSDSAEQARVHSPQRQLAPEVQSALEVHFANQFVFVPL